MLDAIADNALEHGVDSAMNRAFHQGLDTADTGQLPGMDALKDAIRNARQEAIDKLHNALTPEGLSDASAMAGSPQIEQLLTALQNRSSAFASTFAGANHGVQTELETLLNAGTPGESSETIREQLERLIDLAELEQVVRRVRSVEDVDEIDPELLRTIAGDMIADRFQQLTAGLQSIQDAGYIVRSGSRATLSARAIQQIGDSLLEQTLARIDARGWGDHRNNTASQSHDATGTSRQYRYGDPFDLDIAGSLLNAVRQSPGTPVRFNPNDLQVIEREASERATTILAIDLSRSMGERGLLLVARKLALALSTWIRRRFPHDELHLIGFSESARPLALQELVDLQWDRYGYGTNIHDALRTANRMLASHRGRKRNLVLLTDGEPTAHRDAAGEIIFNHPPAPETLAHTYREAHRLRTEGVYLCVCVLSESATVGNFGRELARHAAGDVLITRPDDLGVELLLRYSARRR